MIRTRLRTAAVLASLLLGLGGCASRSYHGDVPEPKAPVARPAPPPAAPVAATYRVKSGDSLHSIAFAAGTDWRKLADLNRIGPPYTIYPGQLLTLGSSASRTALGRESGQTETTRAGVEPEHSVPIYTHGGVLAAPGTEAAIAEKAAPPTAPPPPPVKPGDWQWPSAGKLILGFSGGAQPHKGIDIAGNRGDPIVAAKGGTVVYAGDQVRGYGNLLIVKHDELFLSAYAHNSKLLVREGEVVKRGQQIAEMGDSGTDRTKLHFEVRRQGNPVDPLQVLPKR